LEFALELLGFEHKTRERLAECLDTAASLSLKSNEVLAHIADARAEVPLSAEACCLLLGHFGLDTEKLEFELAATFLEPCYVKRGAGLSWHHPCWGCREATGDVQQVDPVAELGHHLLCDRRRRLHVFAQAGVEGADQPA